MKLLLYPDTHEVEEVAVGPATAERKERRGLLFNLPEGVIRRDADGQVDGPTLARAEEALARVRPEERRLQQPLLGGEREHWIGHAATLDPRGAHLGNYVAQPARVNTAAWPETFALVVSILDIEHFLKLWLFCKKWMAFNSLYK